MAGISPSIFQPQPYAGYNPSYAPSGYMPGAPAGFIMNPFVYIPPKPVAAPTVPTPEVYYPQPYIDTQQSSEETPQQQQERAIAEAKQLDYYLPSGELNPDYSGPTYMGGNVDEQGRPIPGYAATMPDINYKDIGSVGLSLALGGPLAAAYTAADKFVLNDALPGPLDALKAVGNVVGSVGGALGGLLGLNTQPVTTSSSTDKGLSIEPLPPPPFVAAEQYDGYGTTYDQPYTGWQDTTDYGYQTPELTWSPGEDVASWSEDLAQAAEAEQWGG